MQRLRESGKGSIESDDKGNVWFQPESNFVDELKIRSKNRRKSLRRQGVPLVHEGRPLCQALDAAGFLGEENKSLLHMVMLRKGMEEQQDRVYTLLRALDIVTPESFHNIFFDDSQEANPKLVAYGIMRQLERQTSQLIEHMNAYKSTS